MNTLVSYKALFEFGELTEKTAAEIYVAQYT